MCDYELLARQIAGLAETERNWVSVLANASALLMEALDDINWVGFYLMRDGRLVVGPFQGKVACVAIEVGLGVCGSAVARNQTLRVNDVHAFAGHIACDLASASEVVVPIRHDGRVVGVLDVDSPRRARFHAADVEGLEEIVRVLESVVEWE